MSSRFGENKKKKSRKITVKPIGAATTKRPRELDSESP